jgi:hypothetical protein
VGKKDLDDATRLMTSPLFFKGRRGDLAKAWCIFKAFAILSSRIAATILTRDNDYMSRSNPIVHDRQDSYLDNPQLMGALVDSLGGVGRGIKKKSFSDGSTPFPSSSRAS